MSLLSFIIPFVIVTIDGQNNVIELTLQQKRMILDRHNSIRQDCANGLYTIDGPQYASNMVYLFWDKGLEDMAKVRASYCNFDSFGGSQGIQDDFDANKQNITFNEPLSGYTVGENVAPFSQDPPVSQYSDSIFTNGIQTWASEGLLYDWPNNICFADTCNNWGQVCSGPTRYIGCAFVECYAGINGTNETVYTDGGMVLVCNYYPGVDLANYPFEDGLTFDSCIRCQQWDVRVCENNVCKGGKARDWLASGLINSTIDQCQDGLGRRQDPCTTIDPTKSPTQGVSTNPTIATNSPVISPTTSRQPSPRPTLFGVSNPPTFSPNLGLRTLSPTISTTGPTLVPTTSTPTQTHRLTLPPTGVVTQNPTQILSDGPTKSPIIRTNIPRNDMNDVNIHNNYIIYGNNNSIINNNYFNNNIKSNNIIQCACFDIIDISNSNNKCYINYMGGKIIKIYNSNNILKYEYIIDYIYNDCKCYKNNKLILYELSIPTNVFDICLSQLNNIRINPCSNNANIIAIKSLNNISYILKRKKGTVIQIITIMISLTITLVIVYVISRCVIKKFCLKRNKYTLIHEESSSNVSNDDIMT